MRYDREKEQQMTLDLEEYIGKKMEISGVAHTSKAGSFLVYQETCIWIFHHEWTEEENDKMVRITGVLSKRKEPTFPIAEQDEEGGWSQGISVPSLEMGAPSFSLEEWTFIVESVVVQ